MQGFHECTAYVVQIIFANDNTSQYTVHNLRNLLRQTLQNQYKSLLAINDQHNTQIYDFKTQNLVNIINETASYMRMVSNHELVLVNEKLICYNLKTSTKRVCDVDVAWSRVQYRFKFFDHLLCAVLTNDSTVIVWNLQTFETLFWKENQPLEVVDFIYLEDKTLVHVTNDDDFLQQRHLGSEKVSEAYLEAEGSACRIDRLSEDKIVINTVLEFVQLTSTYQVFNMKTKTLLWRVQGIELLASHFLPLSNHQFLALQSGSSTDNVDQYCIWDTTESKSILISGASVTNGIYHFGCGVVSNGYLGLQSDKQNVIVVNVSAQEVLFRRTYTSDVCFALW